jgi:hypothetical protein
MERVLVATNIMIIHIVLRTVVSITANRRQAENSSRVV